MFTQQHEYPSEQRVAKKPFFQNDTAVGVIKLKKTKKRTTKILLYLFQQGHSVEVWL